MNRSDRVTLATQYARRGVREGLTITEAVERASLSYGLSNAARADIRRKLKSESKTTKTRGAAK